MIPFVSPNFSPALPEIIVLVMACFALLVSLFDKKNGVKSCYFLVQLTLIAVAVISISKFNLPPTITFNGAFILDNLACLLKAVIALATFAVFLYSRTYVVESFKEHQAEYYLLGLFSVLGMMVLVSAYDLISLFLGLELFSLPVYAMVALRRDSKICTEASMKYFVIGSIASGMMLYGMSMLYGATKSLDIPVIAQAILNTPPDQQLIAIFGLVFVVVGIGFKLGGVPFHMWVPDVYEGAPSSVTLFITTAPKVAAAGMAIRLLVDAAPSLVIQWQELLMIISILSMAIGNLVAIVQSNLKRMLAYSSISHMGYMLLGFVAGTPEGFAAAIFYAIAYVLMSLVAFGMILVMSKAGFEAERIDDFQGLNSRNPWLAFMMLLTMFSMAGIPPLVGFMAKVAVLEALIEVHQVWLVVVALLFAIIGAYYYLKVVKVIYFEKPVDPKPIKWSMDVKVVMSINAILILVLGFFPGFVLDICRAAF